MNTRRLLSRTETADFLGITPQSVSNWTVRGILHAHKFGRDIKYDRQALESMFEDLKSLHESEERAKELQAETESLCSDLESQVKDFRKALGLFGCGAPSSVRQNGIALIISLARGYEDSLSGRERDILIEFFQTGDIASIATRYYLSNTRIIQILMKGLRRLEHAVHASLPWDENKKLKEQICSMQHLIDVQSERIKELEHSLGIKSLIESGHLSEEELRICALLKTECRDLPFSVRTLNCFVYYGISTVEDLVHCSRREIFRLRNIGKRHLSEVEDFLESNGLCFEMDTKELMQRYEYYLYQKYTQE